MSKHKQQVIQKRENICNTYDRKGSISLIYEKLMSINEKVIRAVNKKK